MTNEDNLRLQQILQKITTKFLCNVRLQLLSILKEDELTLISSPREDNNLFFSVQNTYKLNYMNIKKRYKICLTVVHRANSRGYSSTKLK